MELSQMSLFASCVLIFVSATFTDNILMARFLGMCSCLGVSKKVDTSLGLGLAVMFVTAVTAALNYLVYQYMLVPLHLEYLKLIIFIVVIAAFTQLVEMIIERTSEKLYNSLGIFLPLITVNCAILGVILFVVIRHYNFLQSVLFSIGSGLGWWLAIDMLAAIREKLANVKLPPGIKGPAIAFIITGIMAMAFIGFSGIFTIQ